MLYVGKAFLFSFLVAGIYFLLAKGIFTYRDPGASAKRRTPNEERIAAGTIAVLLWQAMLVLLFLPLTVFAASAVAFLVAVTLTELMLAWSEQSLTRRALLTNFSIFFAFVVLILAQNQWRL